MLVCQQQQKRFCFCFVLFLISLDLETDKLFLLYLFYKAYPMTWKPCPIPMTAAVVVVAVLIELWWLLCYFSLFQCSLFCSVTYNNITARRSASSCCGAGNLPSCSTPHTSMCHGIGGQAHWGHSSHPPHLVRQTPRSHWGEAFCWLLLHWSCCWLEACSHGWVIYALVTLLIGGILTWLGNLCIGHAADWWNLHMAG